MQHLRGAVAVCERIMQHLHSVVAVCETTMQHLHSPVAVCETTMQHLHSVVAVCETTMQHLRNPFAMCAPTTGTIIHPCGMSGGRMQFAPTRVPGQTSLPPQGPPLPRGQSFIPAGCLGGVCFCAPTCIRQTSLPPQGPPLHGYPANLAGIPDAPSQLLGIVNA